MTKKLGDNKISTARRREAIMLILAQNEGTGVILTQNAIRDELAKLKHPIVVGQVTISNDLREINKEDTFVRDIAQYHYSTIKRKIADNFIWVANEALKNYKEKWTNNKIVHRTTPDGTMTEETVTGEIASAKQGFLRICLEANKAYDELTDGRPMKISVDMLKHELTRVKTELDNAVKQRLVAATAR